MKQTQSGSSEMPVGSNKSSADQGLRLSDERERTVYGFISLSRHILFEAIYGCFKKWVETSRKVSIYANPTTAHEYVSLVIRIVLS